MFRQMPRSCFEDFWVRPIAGPFRQICEIGFPELYAALRSIGQSRFALWQSANFLSARKEEPSHVTKRPCQIAPTDDRRHGEVLEPRPRAASRSVSAAVAQQPEGIQGHGNK